MSERGDYTPMTASVDHRCPPGWVVLYQAESGTFSATCGNASMVGRARNLAEVYEAIRPPPPLHPEWDPSHREIL